MAGATPRSQTGEFWEQRAREDPYYFVDNRGRHREPDLERFWQQGEVDLDRLLGLLGARIETSDHVLEIGCGVGRLTRVLAARADQISNDPRVHVPPARTGRMRDAVRLLLAPLSGGSPRGVDQPVWLGSAGDLGELRQVASAVGLTVEHIIGAGTRCCGLLARCA
jgi:SAM-dependent methyltransferase